MMRVLLWKEYREHRSIWLAMAALSALILLALFALLDPPGAIPPHSDKGEIIAGVGGSLLIIYGFVCGSIMLAGEYESGSVRFLDALTGSRSRVWWAKTLAGTGLVLSQALCVCALIFGLGARMGSLPVMAGLGILIAVCLGTFAWGMLGSSLCRSVVMAAAMALLLFIFLGTFSGLAFAFLLDIACRWSVIRDDDFLGVFSLAVPAVLAIVSSGLVFCRLDLEQRTSRVRSTPKPRSTPWFPSWRVLLWLAFRQGWKVAMAVVIAGFMLGLMAPFNEKAMMFWPPATAVIGVLCGTGIFAGEQADGSYRFLGAQRLPAGRVWIVKTIFWLTAPVVAALLTLGAFCLHLALASDSEQHNWTEVWKGTESIRRLVPTGIFLMGWLFTGFCVGQFFALVWRKSVVAIVASLAIAGAVAAVWIPSLVAGGLHAWQVFGPPILLLVATRLSMWPWMAGRLYSFRPATILAGGAMLALAFLAGSIWYRQAEIPNVGEPFDVRAFTASIPGPEHNKAPEAIKDALLKSQERVMEADFKLGPPNPIRLKPHPPSDTARAQGQAAEGQAAAAVPAEVFDALGGEPEIPAKDYFELIDYVLNDDFPVDDPQLGKWLDEVFQIEEMKHLREAIPLPLGVFIDPRTEWMKHLRKAVQLPLAVFIDPRTADVLSDRRIEHPGYLAAKAILGRALQLQSRKKDAEALDHIMTVLALSRHFRNMADTSSYLLALTIEKWAVEVLDRWVRQLGSNPDLLRRALDELTRHQARIPPNDFLKTDYLKSRHNLNDIHIRHALILPGIKVQPAEKSLFQDVLEFAWQVPWEKNRLERIRNLLFAGWLRGIEVDYSELLDQKFDMNQRRESQAWPLLRNWLPPQPGPASSWTRERLGDVVDESVLGKFLQYSPVNARMYSDFRDAYREGTRLQLALMLYQYENKKPAPSLKALVPKYLPELPKDPFSGQSFHYRVSAGELISQTYNTEPIRVPAGQGILWSVGPDGIDNRGTKQGAPSSSMDPSVWNRGGFDLIFLVPPWPKEKQ